MIKENFKKVPVLENLFVIIFLWFGGMMPPLFVYLTFSRTHIQSITFIQYGTYIHPSPFTEVPPQN
jgi:hypothetical protein